MVLKSKYGVRARQSEKGMTVFWNMRLEIPEAELLQGQQGVEPGFQSGAEVKVIRVERFQSSHSAVLPLNVLYICPGSAKHRWAFFLL